MMNCSLIFLDGLCVTLPGSHSIKYKGRREAQKRCTLTNSKQMCFELADKNCYMKYFIPCLERRLFLRGGYYSRVHFHKILSANGFSSEEAAKQKGSRMSLIWQVAKPSEFYCLEELESLEVRGTIYAQVFHSLLLL